MENFDISQKDTHLHIEGFPDAVKVISIDGPYANRLSDLALHKADLDFADECLDAINLTPEDPSIIREALWRSSIIHFLKCFGDAGARFQLSPEKILKGEPLEAVTAFNYFKNLRNRHLVHDENSYSQSFPGAILNKRDKDYKIEKIVCLASRAVTLDQGNFGNLKLLIQKTRSWVVVEFDNICEYVTKELESQSYETLLTRDSIDFRVPVVDEIGKNRKGH
jgi:hypothetical protein